MKQKLPKIISAIFNPPFVNAYVLVIYFTLNSSVATMSIIVGVIMFLFVIPWTPVLLYWVITRKSPSKLPSNKRIPFIIVGIASYALGVIYFYLLSPKAYEFLMVYHLTYFINSILLLVGSIKSKPSVHISGFVIPVILLSLYTNIFFILLLLITPIIGWSRLRLGIHTIGQLVLGFVIGILSIMLSISLLKITFNTTFSIQHYSQNYFITVK